MSTTDCVQVLRELQLYLDGEIAGSQCEEIERHLEGCGPCLHHADFLRAVRELLHARCGCDEVPADLEAKVRSSLRFPEP